MTREIKITFECNQDWEEMKISKYGRYCDLCSKVVHDFSDKPKSEILRLSKGDLCGMFLTEQIHSDLKPIEFRARLKAALLAIGAVVGIEVCQVQGQHQDKGNKIENLQKDTTRNETIISTTRRPKLNSKKPELTDCDRVKKTVETKYYFTKRFPFIVKRKIRVIGRYRI